MFLRTATVWGRGFADSHDGPPSLAASYGVALCRGNGMSAKRRRLCESGVWFFSGAGRGACARPPWVAAPESADGHQGRTPLQRCACGRVLPHGAPSGRSLGCQSCACRRFPPHGAACRQIFRVCFFCAWCLHTATGFTGWARPAVARKLRSRVLRDALQGKTECQQARLRWELRRGALQDCLGGYWQSGGCVARLAWGLSYASGEVALLRPRRARSSANGNAGCPPSLGASIPRAGLWRGNGMSAKRWRRAHRFVPCCPEIGGVV